MQYLKEDIREKIIWSAKRQFSENGYMDTSMRNIADDVGIVSGNIYRYYKNKEELFNSVVHSVTLIFDSIDDDIKPKVFKICDDRKNDNGIETMKAVTEYVLGIFNDCYGELVIALDKSGGTSLSASAQIFYTFFDEVIRYVFTDKEKKLNAEKFNCILKIITTSYTKSLGMIVRENLDNQEKIHEYSMLMVNILFEKLNNCK